jgi:hypothetical protein
LNLTSGSFGVSNCDMLISLCVYVFYAYLVKLAKVPLSATFFIASLAFL